MRILVTGATGFVGKRLVQRLLEAGEHEVHGLSRNVPAVEPSGWQHHVAELGARNGALELVRELAPQRVYHLAAVAHPGDCTRYPKAAMRVQVEGTRELCEGLDLTSCRVLAASSASVYGPVRNDPLAEYSETSPTSAYGRSKLAAEEVAREFGSSVRIARPFNHSGAGQSTRYVLPALAQAALDQVESERPARTGNLWPQRDFLHIDDVLDAYELLIELDEDPGPVNVCRGRAVPIGLLLSGLQERLEVPRRNKRDPKLVRRGELPVLVGDNRLLRGMGWRPRIELEDLLDEIASAAGARASS